MFSLLVTVITIALVAVLAVATVYYGGDLYTSQQALTTAATLDAQAQQVFSAAVLYSLDTGEWPASAALLVAEHKYLTAVPVPPGVALRQEESWTALLPPSGPQPAPMSAATGSLLAYGEAALDFLVTPAHAFTFATPEEPPPAPAGEDELSRPLESYLSEPSVLSSAFQLRQADAEALHRQLVTLSASRPAAARDALKLLEVHADLRAAGAPSMLDYHWPAAAAIAGQRFLWIPDRVNPEVCAAANQRHRGSLAIPQGFSVRNGPIQCFGNSTTGYTYLWLAPGTAPATIIPALSELGIPVVAEPVEAAPSGGTGPAADEGGTGGTGGTREPSPPPAQVPQDCLADPVSCQLDPADSRVAAGEALVFTGGECGYFTYDTEALDRLDISLLTQESLPAILWPSAGDLFFINSWSAPYVNTRTSPVTSADNCAYFDNTWHNGASRVMDCGAQNNWSVFPFVEMGAHYYNWNNRKGLGLNTWANSTLPLPDTAGKAVTLKLERANGATALEFSTWCDAGVVRIRPVHNVYVSPSATGIAFY